MTYHVWYQELVEVVGLWRRDRAYGDEEGACRRADDLFLCGDVGCVRVVDAAGALVAQRGLEDR